MNLTITEKDGLVSIVLRGKTKAAHPLIRRIAQDEKVIFYTVNINKERKFSKIIVDKPSFGRIVKDVDFILRERIPDEIKTKVCSRCGTRKNRQYFYPNKKNKVDGLQSWCKTCQKEYARERHA